MEQFKVDPTIAYDIVELPSKGIYYDNKKKSLRIAYLTAADENILSAQNLVSSNSIIDELLKRKILDKDLPIEELVLEDKEAILIFLRNTAFGSNYTVTAIDPKTDKEFSFEIDLSTIKIKDFVLEPDVNNEYKYFLEKSKVDITFKFITAKQQKELEDIKNSWNGVGVAPIRTKELEMTIKSINGTRDAMTIRDFIERMPIKDSQDFRKFVEKNKPGLDLSYNVTTPSGETTLINIGFGVDFFRPFYGL